jgi:hypothetical protein
LFKIRAFGKATPLKSVKITQEGRSQLGSVLWVRNNNFSSGSYHILSTGNSGPGYKSELGFRSPGLITFNKAIDKNDQSDT